MKRVPAAIIPFGRHWAIEEGYANLALEKINRVDFTALQAYEPKSLGWFSSGSGYEASEDRPYAVVNGVAIFNIEGPLTKQMNCMQWLFGGTATADLARSVLQALEDPDVRCGLSYFDTPGGSVAGTFAASDAFAKFAKSKRLEAFCSDMCASAGYAIAASHKKIYADRTALIGSLGTYMEIEDSSDMAKEMGLKVHIVRYGEMKGAGAPGTVVTGKMLTEFQRNVNSLTAQFIQTVADGRGMSYEEADALFNGTVDVGQEAKDKNLIDDIATFDEVLQGLQQKAGKSASYRRNVSAASGERKKSMSRLGNALSHALAGYKAGWLAAHGEEPSSKAVKADEEDEDDKKMMDGEDEPDEDDDKKSKSTARTAPAPSATVSNGDLAAIQTQMAQMETDRKTERIETALRNLSRQGFVTAGAMDAAKKLMSADAEAFQAFVKANGKVSAFADPRPRAAGNPPNGEDIANSMTGDVDAAATLSALAMKKFNDAKGSLPYAEAMKQAARERPDLASEMAGVRKNGNGGR